MNGVIRGEIMFNSAKNRGRLDRAAISLSVLCAVHCVATIVLLGAFSSLGYFFSSPLIHEVGLALAIIIGAVALGLGVRRHGSRIPLLFGAIGLAVMAAALCVPHGVGEAALTIVGVSMVAIAHYVNMRINTLAGQCWCC